MTPGLSVIGSGGPESEKPDPDNDAPLTVTGALPAEAKVIDCVADVLTATLPKITLAGVMLSASTVAFSCTVKLVNMLPTLAVIVTA
ncbi:MAG: hypothetical protein WCD70_13515 [Alphaproteobacteria bacterium]